MKLKMMAIHDVKSQLFSQPLFFRAYGEAERAFRDVVNDGKSDYSRHPEDYTLFELAEYDDATGSVAPLPAPRSLGAAITFKDSSQLSLIKQEASNA